MRLTNCGQLQSVVTLVQDFLISPRADVGPGVFNGKRCSEEDGWCFVGDEARLIKLRYCVSAVFLYGRRQFDED